MVIRCIGIDPGLTGAAALVSGIALAVFDLPTVVSGSGTVKRELDAAGLARLLASWSYGDEPVKVLLERTSAMPGQGVASMFSMGVSRGIILGVLGALGIPFSEVTPATWKRYYKLIGADKDRSRTLAIQQFPTVAAQLARVSDHNRAEAVLIAAYCAHLQR